MSDRANQIGWKYITHGVKALDDIFDRCMFFISTPFSFAITLLLFWFSCKHLDLLFFFFHVMQVEVAEPLSKLGLEFPDIYLGTCL